MAAARSSSEMPEIGQAHVLSAQCLFSASLSCAIDSSFSDSPTSGRGAGKKK